MGRNVISTTEADDAYGAWRASLFALALAVALTGAVKARAAELPGQAARGAAVTSCTVETDSRANPADAAADDDDDNSEDDTSDGGDEEDTSPAADAAKKEKTGKGGKSDDDEPIAGFLSGDGVTCLGLSGSISAATFGQIVRQPRWQERLQPSDNFGFNTTFSLDVDSSTPFGESYLTTGLSLTLDAKNDPLLSRAAIGWGPWLFGYDTSQFTFWDGGEFAGSAATPQQSSKQIMRRFDFTDTFYSTLSVESMDANVAGGGANGSTPNKDLPPGLVGALGYEGDAFSTKLSLFTRMASEGSNGVTRRAGFGANAGATWDDPSGWSLTAQATLARNAPELVGTRYERRTIANLGLNGFETLGWSGVVAGSRDLSDTLTANAYLSYFRLDLTSPGIDGKFTSWRLAANLSWKPVERLTFALEAGANQTENRLGLGQALAAATRRTGTLTLTISRDF